MTVAVGDFLAQSQVSLGDGFMIVSVYSALLGSTLDTSFVSVYGVFHILYVYWWIMDPEVDSRPALFSALCLVRQRIHAVRQSTEFFIFVNWWIMDPQVVSRPAHFQRLLGSTVDTRLCVSFRGWSSWSRRTSRCFPSLSSGP